MEKITIYTITREHFINGTFDRAHTHPKAFTNKAKAGQAILQYIADQGCTSFQTVTYFTYEEDINLALMETTDNVNGDKYKDIFRIIPIKL
jgi:hypothetical protein